MSLEIGKRVRYSEYRGEIIQISPEGIHYRVKFDDDAMPDWPQIVDGACYFYAHELEPDE